MRQDLFFEFVRDTIDLMHNDVTLPKGSMGVVVTIKSKMAASNACPYNFRDSGSVLFDLSESSNKSPERQLNGLTTSEHMSSLLPFKFPTSGK